MNTNIKDYFDQGMSNNHIAAHNDETKVLCGEAAKRLTKAAGFKISAKTVEAYSTEWHHAGVYYNKFLKKSVGRRVYWIDIDELPNILADLLSKAAPIE